MRKSTIYNHFNKRNPYLWLVIIMLSIMLIGCQSNTEIPVQERTEIPEATNMPIETNTPVPPTATTIPPSETAQPTYTLTSTRTPTETDTPTSTPTPVPPELTFVQNGVCYTGPGWNFDVVQYFLPGEIVSVRGLNEDETWWAISTMETEEDCWIINTGVEQLGSFAAVSILESPPTPTIPPSETPEEKGVKYYLIDMNSPGPFGCGERMVYIYTGNNYTGSIEHKVEQALTALFNQTDRNAFGFYNPIAKYGTRFKVRNVVYRSDGDIDVILTGDFEKPTDDCEAQRIHDQVWQTAEQFSAVGKAHIYLNNVLFGDIVFNK